MSEMEIRSYLVDAVEVREAATGPVIMAYAAVFDELSKDLGGFRERIEAGAFDGALLAESDVRALWQHDKALVLGRTRAGTLELSTDARGLIANITPPETTWAGDAMVSIRRGDVNQMSFGFTVPDGGDRWDKTERGLVRTLERVDLIEVSPVTFPAYLQTTVAVRSKVDALRAQAGIDTLPTDEDRNEEETRGRAEPLRWYFEFEE